MSLKTRIYVGLVISLGAAILGDGLYHWESSNLLRFLFFVALAIPASCLKVTLPGVTGTMSMLFIFLLKGVVDLPLAEALVMGAVCVAAQSFWQAKMRPRAIHVLFSVAAIQISVATAYFTYHSTAAWSNSLRLLVTASVLFIANTFPVAVVIALTEGKAIGRVWSGSYFWCFPYYLVGASVVGLFTFVSAMFDWRAGVLILPVVYVIYRSYHLYLNQLQNERKQAEDERTHAAEVAQLHARTVEALASAISANVRLDAVFRASPLALLTLDGEGRVTGWNAMAEQMFGWRTEDVVGRPLPFAAGQSEESMRGVIERALQGDVFSGEEMKQWRSDGLAFDAAIWTAIFKDADGTSCILITVADRAQTPRGTTAALAENGSRRAAGRRSGARLQQPVDRNQWLQSPADRKAERRPECGWPVESHPGGRNERRGLGLPTSDVQPTPGDQTEVLRGQPVREGRAENAGARYR
jgi:PAS domain S-box-containing protein